MAKAKIFIPTGTRFGLLVVVGDATRAPSGRRVIPCVCDCGEDKQAAPSDLLAGKIISCGCAKRASAKEVGVKNRRHGGVTGGKRSPTYVTWQSMRLRCDNEKTNGYSRYGGRGIRYCEEWKDFARFLQDMGERPKGMTLDRINPDGDYTPENCEWVTPSIQHSNKRTSRHVTHNGKTKTVAEWAREIGVHRNTILRRLNRGVAVEDALKP